MTNLSIVRGLQVLHVLAGYPAQEKRADSKTSQDSRSMCPKETWLGFWETFLNYGDSWVLLTGRKISSWKAGSSS
jgi:hypothetical protein